MSRNNLCENSSKLSEPVDKNSFQSSGQELVECVCGHQKPSKYGTEKSVKIPVQETSNFVNQEQDGTDRSSAAKSNNGVNSCCRCCNEILSHIVNWETKECREQQKSKSVAGEFLKTPIQGSSNSGNQEHVEIDASANSNSNSNSCSCTAESNIETNSCSCTAQSSNANNWETSERHDKQKSSNSTEGSSSSTNQELVETDRISVAKLNSGINFYCRCYVANAPDDVNWNPGEYLDQQKLKPAELPKTNVRELSNYPNHDQVEINRSCSAKSNSNTNSCSCEAKSSNANNWELEERRDQHKLLKPILEESHKRALQESSNPFYKGQIETDRRLSANSNSGADFICRCCATKLSDDVNPTEYLNKQKSKFVDHEPLRTLHNQEQVETNTNSCSCTAESNFDRNSCSCAAKSSNANNWKLSERLDQHKLSDSVPEESPKSSVPECSNLPNRGQVETCQNSAENSHFNTNFICECSAANLSQGVNWKPTEYLHQHKLPSKSVIDGIPKGPVQEPSNSTNQHQVETDGILSENSNTNSCSCTANSTFNTNQPLININTCNCAAKSSNANNMELPAHRDQILPLKSITEESPKSTFPKGTNANSEENSKSNANVCCRCHAAVNTEPAENLNDQEFVVDEPLRTGGPESSNPYQEKTKTDGNSLANSCSCTAKSTLNTHSCSCAAKSSNANKRESSERLDQHKSLKPLRKEFPKSRVHEPLNPFYRVQVKTDTVQEPSNPSYRVQIETDSVQEPSNPSYRVQVETDKSSVAKSNSGTVFCCRCCPANLSDVNWKSVEGSGHRKSSKSLDEESTVDPVHESLNSVDQQQVGIDKRCLPKFRGTSLRSAQNRTLRNSANSYRNCAPKPNTNITKLSDNNCRTTELLEQQKATKCVPEESSKAPVREPSNFGHQKQAGSVRNFSEKSNVTNSRPSQNRISRYSTNYCCRDCAGKSKDCAGKSNFTTNSRTLQNRTLRTSANSRTLRNSTYCCGRDCSAKSKSNAAKDLGQHKLSKPDAEESPGVCDHKSSSRASEEQIGIDRSCTANLDSNTNPSSCSKGCYHCYCKRS